MRRIILGTLAACLAATLMCASASAAALPPTLSVTGASLMVAGSDQLLWSENGNAELPVASTTKLMTALVVLQHVKNLNTVFTQEVWHDQPGDSQVGLVPGDKMTVRDLLVALLLPSADDAAWDLAYNVGGGSVPRFVAMMNDEARKLGLRHTHYTTPSGLDTPGNYSSPDDLVRLADYDMRSFPFFRRTVALRSARIVVGDYPETVTNTDTLLGAVPWITGVKTGHTTEAGYVLVSEGSQRGLTLIASVLGTDSEAMRNASALALLEYGFANFHRITPLRRGQTIARVPVAYSGSPARIVAAAGYSSVVPTSARTRLRTTGVPRQLSGPMRAGAVVGHVRVEVGGRVVADEPLVLRHSLPAVSALTKVGHYLGRPFTLVLLALILGAAVALEGRRRRPRILAAGQLEQR
ncbi:MAG TPA: D-alanyl-D-alanine carboxypeptidase family protein [Solirubrobacteraceae bacterium]|nr:D-alanyl-D-alanine carboxypeptidase family protein [Solirubrobacteraceae bacterium]